MAYWVNVHETHCYRAKEEEYNEWYNSIHLPDVISTDGFVAATRYRIREPMTGRGSYVCVYEIETDDLEKTLAHRKKKCEAEIASGRGSDLWVPAWMFVLFRRRVRKTSLLNSSDLGKQRWIRLVETNPMPGKEEAFNDWYDEILDEVLKMPGYLAASRFAIRAPLEGRGTYLTMYEFENDDSEGALNAPLMHGADEAKRGKALGLCEPVWEDVVFREVFRHPTRA